MSDVQRDQQEEAREERAAADILKNLGLTWADLLGKTVLEVGAGDGALVRAAVGRGINATALDKVLPKGPVPKWFKQGDMYNLPFENGRFDMILLNGVVDVRNVRALEEAYRVTKNDGEIRFSPLYAERSQTRLGERPEQLSLLVLLFPGIRAVSLGPSVADPKYDLYFCRIPVHKETTGSALSV